jgi:hypothetical protein
MMCYRDMTFCSASCANYKCERQFTLEVQEKAIKWWGNERAPIALSDFSDTCEVYMPPKND